MDQNKIEYSKPVPPFVRYCSAIIPTMFDDSLSYYEALCALWKWLQDNLVDVINHNASVTEEYVKLVNDLKEYIETYFDNLDVQDEINNKLDQMAEDGTLQEIVVNYVKTQMISQVEFLFNPQIDVNPSYYSLTSDVTPVSGKTYYVKSDNPLANNGYEAYNGLQEFEAGVNYYERSSSYSNITGECFIIKVGDKTVMIDTGGVNRREVIKQYLADNNVTKVDYLIISHYHSDHCANLGYLAQYVDFTDCMCYLAQEAPVDPAVDPQITSTIMGDINSLGLSYVYPDEGDVLTIGDFKITFYNCGDTAFQEINDLYIGGTRRVNNYSMLCLATYYDRNVLYGADIEKIAQQRLHEHEFFKDITIDLYKWHHHGVNTLENCYVPFIEEIDPRRIVIVSNTIEITNTDELLYNAVPSDYCYEKTLIWETNGSTFKLKKNILPELKTENRMVYSNSLALNSLVGFLKIRNAVAYKKPSIRLKIDDAQNGKFHGIVQIEYQIGVNPTDIKNFKIRTLSSWGGEYVQDLIYLVNEGDSVKIFLKKIKNNRTPVVTVLDFADYEQNTLLEPIYETYTTADFETAYPSAFHDPYLHELTLNSDYFAVSGGKEGNKLVWYKKNGVVEIFGLLTNTADIPAGGANICVLPNEIYPRRATGGAVGWVQQSNGINRWFAQVDYDSNNQVAHLRFSRYGSGSNTTCPTGAWLPVEITYQTEE